MSATGKYRRLKWQVKRAVLPVRKPHETDAQKLKRANKIMGRQGETIHLLRAELAETRMLTSKIDRGDMRRYERNALELKDIIDKQYEQIRELKDKIKELENPNDGVLAEVVPLDAEPTSEYVGQ